MPLADEIKDAIVKREGPLGALLTVAVDLERSGVVTPNARHATALYTSVQWANAQLGEFAAAPAG